MATLKQPSAEQMLEELRQKAVGPREPLTPIDTAKRNLQGIYEGVSAIPGNIKRMVQDPLAYAKSIPAPTGDQIMNAIGPGNVGMAGIMIGPKAKTWHAGRADMAQAMEKAGRTPQEIWQATGTYRGPEGKWRQEIDDSKAVHRHGYEIKQKAQQLQDQQAMLKIAANESLAHGKEVVSDLFPKEAIAARKAVKQQVSNIDDELGGYFGLKQNPQTRGNLLKHGYEHPELYAAYPELANYVLTQGRRGDPGTLGSLHANDVQLYQEGVAQKNPGSTIAHELQHAIQDIERTPRGGNVYEFMKARQDANEAIKGHNDALSYIAKRMDEASDPAVRRDLKATYDEMLERRARPSHYTHIDPYQEYRKLGGEAESRMVQARLDMTPEQRAQTYPLQLDKDVAYDVDPKQLRLLNQGEQINIYKAQGGTVTPFDYENPKHVNNVANIAAKHKDFSQIPGVAGHLAESLSKGSYKFIEDPRIQSAIKQAGHKGYFFQGKDGKQQIVSKADGGVVPSMEKIKAEMMSRFKGLGQMQSIGANEAPGMAVKAFVPTSGSPDNNRLPVGGVDTSRGPLPVGGIDMNNGQPGQQMQPAPAGDQPGMDQMPQGDKMPSAMPGVPSGSPSGMPPGTSNILNMTPQGQAMAAMKPQGLAKGGQPSVDDMKQELASKDKRVTIKADGPGGVKGIVVPRHTLEGNAKVGAVGLHEMNEARAKVYGNDHRPPLTLNKIASEHKKTLADHFAKPVEEQHEAEAAALKRLRAAKHLGSTANTLDESEKLDTVRHETDEKGRTHIGFAAKGVAGHALYTSGSGKDTKYHVINTCPGQTEGCGGGKDSEGVVDTKKGTCFAPNAESQYAGAATRRAAHAQAKHDPAMTNDWILAHTGSLRNAARLADKGNQRLLFRPNVVDETDVSSRHAIRHLNEQRKADGKPPIIANSYGKTNELHDPENGYHVTHSNVGPKVKKGKEITENIGRDKARVRNTVMAADNKGDFKNEQGNKTPPKGSYMVTDVKRGSPMAKKMEEHITHAKYWTTGREEHELTDEEKKEGSEGHFSGSGRSTTEDKAHYGHKTVDGKRFDYQRQHILHPRLVQVGKNKDDTPHMIPTDSRFKDTEFLPKDRFKTKNGKDAGHILMTTPTESTSNLGHQTSFTHHVNDGHIEHAAKNNGEYEIDKPEDQIKAKGKEYAAPQQIKFLAEGGSVGGRHHGLSHDDFHAFPEQNIMAQRHLAMRRGDDESDAKHSSSGHKRKVTMANDMDTMMLELTRNKKAK